MMMFGMVAILFTGCSATKELGNVSNSNVQSNPIVFSYRIKHSSMTQMPYSDIEYRYMYNGTMKTTNYSASTFTANLPFTVGAVLDGAPTGNLYYIMASNGASGTLTIEILGRYYEVIDTASTSTPYGGLYLQKFY